MALFSGGLNLTPAAREVIAREGCDPVFGARPLKRVLQKEILDALSLEILAGEFRDGDRRTAKAFRSAELGPRGAWLHWGGVVC